MNLLPTSAVYELIDLVGLQAKWLGFGRQKKNIFHEFTNLIRWLAENVLRGPMWISWYIFCISTRVPRRRRIINSYACEGRRA